MSRGGRAGFVLIPVVLAIGIVAALAWLLARQGTLEAHTVAGERDAETAFHVAEAGFHHARWLVKSGGCSGLPGLPPTPFGPHGYSAVFTPTGPASVEIAATGTLASGISRTVAREVVVPAAPISEVLQPDPVQGKDTYLNDNQNLANFGSEAEIRVTNKAGGKDHGLIRFDLSTIPAAATISSALLELNLEGIGSGNSGQVFVHRVTQSWDEMQASWLERNASTWWSVAGGDHDPTVMASAPVDALAPGPRQLDLTALVSGWTSGSFPNHGLMLKASLGLNHVDFTTSDSPTPGLRPKLTIVYACPCGVPCVTGYYRDEFNQSTCDPSVDYTGSDGLLDWSGQAWQEIGDGGDPCTGTVRLAADQGADRVRLMDDGRGVERAVDLSSFDTARLSFVYRYVDFESSDYVAVETWDEATTAWVEVGRIEGTGTLASYESLEFDLSPYASATSAIRLVTVGLGGSGSGTDQVFVDDVQIDRQTVAPGPTTVTLDPLADMRIEESAPATNYGADPLLRLGIDASTRDLRTLVEFDVSSIPPTATVNSAVLRLYVAATAGSKPVTVGLYKLTGDWDEGTDTWGTLGGGVFDPAELSRIQVEQWGGWFGWPVQPGLIHEWRDGVTPNFGLLLRPVGTSKKNDIVDPASREHATAAWHPQLVVEYVLP